MGFSQEFSDLSSEHLWSTLLHMIRDQKYDCVIMGPPRTTFSRARQGPPGPAPLRSMDYLYGLPRGSLSSKDQEEVKLGFTSQPSLHRLAWCACTQARPNLWGTRSHGQTQHPSSFSRKFKRWPTARRFTQSLSTSADSAPEGRSPHTFCTAALSCRAGQSAVITPTDVDLHRLAGPTPQEARGAHPTLLNRLRDGKPATQAAAAYPYELNNALVKQPSIGSSPQNQLPHSPDSNEWSPGTGVFEGRLPLPLERYERLRTQPRSAACGTHRGQSTGSRLQALPGNRRPGP
jgi:hypothetical protein